MLALLTRVRPQTLVSIVKNRELQNIFELATLNTSYHRSLKNFFKNNKNCHYKNFAQNPMRSIKQ